MNSAKGQDAPQLAEAPWLIALAFVHLEEVVQDREQEEVGREEQGVGETHGKEPGEEQRENRRSINRSPWMTMSME